MRIPPASRRIAPTANPAAHSLNIRTAILAGTAIASALTTNFIGHRPAESVPTQGKTTGVPAQKKSPAAPKPAKPEQHNIVALTNSDLTAVSMPLRPAFSGQAPNQLTDKLIFPIRLEIATATSISAEVTAVEVENRIQPKLKKTVKATISGKESNRFYSADSPSFHALILDVTVDNDYLPGNYAVRLQIKAVDAKPKDIEGKPGKPLANNIYQSITVQFSAPETTLATYGSSIVEHVENLPPWQNSEGTYKGVIALQESGLQQPWQKLRLSTNSAAVFRDEVLIPDASVTLDEVKNPVEVQIPFKVTGSLPLGVSKAKVVLTSPQVKQDTPVEIEVRRRLHPIWITFCVFCGLIAGAIFRVWLPRRNAYVALTRKTEALFRELVLRSRAVQDEIYRTTLIKTAVTLFEATYWYQPGVDTQIDLVNTVFPRRVLPALSTNSLANLENALAQTASDIKAAKDDLDNRTVAARNEWEAAGRSLAPSFKLPQQLNDVLISAREYHESLSPLFNVHDSNGVSTGLKSLSSRLADPIRSDLAGIPSAHKDWLDKVAELKGKAIWPKPLQEKLAEFKTAADGLTLPSGTFDDIYKFFGDVHSVRDTLCRGLVASVQDVVNEATAVHASLEHYKKKVDPTYDGTSGNNQFLTTTQNLQNHLKRVGVDKNTVELEDELKQILVEADTVAKHWEELVLTAVKGKVPATLKQQLAARDFFQATEELNTSVEDGAAGAMGLSRLQSPLTDLEDAETPAAGNMTQLEAFQTKDITVTEFLDSKFLPSVQFVISLALITLTFYSALGASFYGTWVDFEKLFLAAFVVDVTMDIAITRLSQ